jgi:hypothetical protein
MELGEVTLTVSLLMMRAHTLRVRSSHQRFQATESPSASPRVALFNVQSVQLLKVNRKIKMLTLPSQHQNVPLSPSPLSE